MIGKKVCFFQTIDSTNDHMKAHMDDFRDGDLICARIQTKGKGRRERSWISKEGNLHLSFLQMNKEHKITPFDVVVKTSLAVVDALKEYKIDALIKYPNDVLVDGRKIAGILIESVAERYVVGVGINIAFSDKDAYEFHPSSILIETGRFIDYRDVLSVFIKAYNSYDDYSTEVLYDKYKTYSVILNKHVVVNGEDVFVVDVTPQGELVIHKDGVTTKIQANEVSMHGEDNGS